MWKQRLLLAAGVVGALVSSSAVEKNVYAVNLTAEHANAASPGQSFVSYSIEFSSFPDFAGNKSNPNTFTSNLIQNIGSLLGSKPYIRVGGNTQDFALYNASLPTQINGTYDSNPSGFLDYPTTVYIGPSYFESYVVLPAGVRFSHGFNLGLGAKTADGWQTLLDTAPLACRALGRDRFYAYEYGNEPNDYRHLGKNGRPPTRGKGWGPSDYVREWLNGTRAITRQMERYCPELAAADREFMAPSSDDRGDELNMMDVWKLGLDRRGDVNTFSVHNYISGAGSPGVTLQHTLMNHSMTTRDLDQQLAVYKNITSAGKGPRRMPPLIMGETNSLYDEGKPGLSNTFGAALWGLDFLMYAASAGYERVHMHQGTNYRYQSWQPIETDKTVKGTKAPYYGNIAAAAALGNDGGKCDVRVSSVPVSSDMEAAYAVYACGRLQRILVINMHGYNTTRDGAGLEPTREPAAPRRSRSFSFLLSSSSSWPSSCGSGGVAAPEMMDVQRLMANGSDAITGITWDGWSYNWELDGGRPGRLGNVTTGEAVRTDREGVVSVQVPDSSAALLTVRGGGGDA